MNNKLCGIYKITNLYNNKVYIGQSVDIEERWKQHLRAVENPEYSIHKAIKKYGIENFSFEIVELKFLTVLDMVIMRPLVEIIGVRGQGKFLMKMFLILEKEDY